MIYFDEKSIAEKMHDTQSFIKKFCVSELSIYAKWLRYKASIDLGKDIEDFSEDENKTIDKDIERELINFCDISYPSFNYTVNYVEIDKAIDISKKYRLKLPKPTQITESEWKSIMSIDNDDYRRILFVALVDAKYYDDNHTAIYVKQKEHTNYWIRMSMKEIFKIAKTKIRVPADKRTAWHFLGKSGFIGISSGIHNIKYINIVDNDSDVIDYITDYDHINLHYEKLMGEKIGCCKHCGKLFRQGKQNNAEYCYKHRGYRKIGLDFRICIDCGSEFSVSATNMKKIRCDKCQTEYKKVYDRKRKNSKK